MRAKITKIGDWPAFARLAANLTKELENARILSLRRWGLKAEAIAKTHLSTQDLAGTTWAPLSSRHISFKSRKGYSLHTLVMTSTYFQNITTWVDKPQGAVYVGVKVGKVVKTGPSRGQELDRIARVLEYGYGPSNLPPRPLWEPTLNETMTWHVESRNRPGDLFLQAITLKYT